MIKLGITDGPSEKGLLFSLMEDGRKYEVSFKVDGLGYYPVVINRLVRTDNPAVWGWHGQVSGFIEFSPAVHGLFDVRLREGVLFSDQALSRRGIGGSVRESTVKGRHPVELRIREESQFAITKGPSKSKTERLEKKVDQGSEPWLHIELADSPKGIQVQLIHMERFGTGHYYEGTMSPPPSRESRLPVHVSGYWVPQHKRGFIAPDANFNSHVLEGLAL